MGLARWSIRCGVVALSCLVASCGDDGGSSKKDAGGTAGEGGSAGGSRKDGSAGGSHQDGSIGGAHGDGSTIQPDATAADAGLDLGGVTPPAMLTATVSRTVASSSIRASYGQRRRTMVRLWLAIKSGTPLSRLRRRTSTTAP